MKKNLVMHMNWETNSTFATEQFGKCLLSMLGVKFIFSNKVCQEVDLRSKEGKTWSRIIFTSPS